MPFSTEKLQKYQILREFFCLSYWFSSFYAVFTHQKGAFFAVFVHYFGLFGLISVCFHGFLAISNKKSPL